MVGSDRWTVADYRALLARPDAFCDGGVLRGSPVIVVDTPYGLPAHPPLSATMPFVSVAVVDFAVPFEAAQAFDVVVTSDADARAVCAAVDAAPRASVMLAQLLRLQASLTPLNALAAESLAYATLQGGDEFARWLASRGDRVRKPDETPRLTVNLVDDTAVVTLNRPRLFNLYDAAMRDQLVDALRALVADDDIKRLELRGAGKAFCAGGDLAEFGTTRDTSFAHLIRMSANAAPLLVAAAPKLHAYVHGAAVGAGCEMAAFAHHVVATPEATFALPEVAMGLVPGAGGTVSVTRRIGRHRMAWMTLTGVRVDAETALAWGLVDEIAESAA